MPNKCNQTLQVYQGCRGLNYMPCRIQAAPIPERWRPLAPFGLCVDEAPPTCPPPPAPPHPAAAAGGAGAPKATKRHRLSTWVGLRPNVGVFDFTYAGLAAAAAYAYADMHAASVETLLGTLCALDLARRVHTAWKDSMV